MIRYHARWILPIAEPPIGGGWVVADRSRIVAVGSRNALPPPASAGSARSARSAGNDVQLGDVALLPGLVNAHTHLELSYLRDQFPPAPSFIAWIRAVMAARRRQPDPSAAVILDAMERAIVESSAFGTIAVGDISNTLVSFPALARSPLAGVVFFELLGFNVADAEALVERARQDIHALGVTGRLRASLAAHAPYSVAPALFRAIRQAIDRDPDAPCCSVHLSESVEEMEFLRTGSGPMRQLLEELGVWNGAWRAPGVSPVQFLDESGFLDDRTLAVHGVQMTPADLSRLASRGTTLVTCPRSSALTGAGVPPIESFYASGVRVAVGTDSLASAPDLSVFAELASLHALAPAVPAAQLLASATIAGARALGIDGDYGSIAPGKSARLIAVTLPAGLADVEEYLVSGVRQEQIAWVESP